MSPEWVAATTLVVGGLLLSLELHLLRLVGVVELTLLLKHLLKLELLVPRHVHHHAAAAASLVVRLVGLDGLSLMHSVCSPL